MVLLEKHKLCFFHVPKCGGSTVRDQLAPFDDLKGEFHGPMKLEKWGRQQKAHLPAWTIREAVPDLFARIAPVERIMIARDPSKRFLSSFSQYAREILGKPVADLTGEEIKAAFAEITDNIPDGQALPAFQYRHFIQQSQFATLDDAPYIQHIFAIENMAQLLAFVEGRSGISLAKDFHANKTFEFRYPLLQKPLIATKDALKKVIPIQTYGRLKDFGMKHFAKEGQPERVQKTMADLGLHDIINRHYLADQALHQAALSRSNIEVH